MNFISKLSKPLRNVQSFAIKHWKYIFVMFVLIAYIIHALFRKEGMMEYMDTPKSGNPAGMDDLAEALTDVVENHNDRLAVMEKNLQNLTNPNPNPNLDMSSGVGELMDNSNGPVGSEEEQQPPQTNMMQATPPAEAEASATPPAEAEAEAEASANPQANPPAEAEAEAPPQTTVMQATPSAAKLFNNRQKKNKKRRNRRR